MVNSWSYFPYNTGWERHNYAIYLHKNAKENTPYLILTEKNEMSSFCVTRDFINNRNKPYKITHRTDGKTITRE